MGYNVLANAALAHGRMARLWLVELGEMRHVDGYLACLVVNLCADSRGPVRYSFANQTSRQAAPSRRVFRKVCCITAAD
jgi:hypothetical protein